MRCTLMTLASMAALLTACQSMGDIPPQADLAISNVNIVDVETGAIQPAQTVTIKEGSILAIRETRATDAQFATTYIDGENAYMIPGLWDMHVHLKAVTPDGQAEIDPAQWHIPLAISHGILGIRDLASNMDVITTLRDEMDARRARGQAAPDLFIAGTLFSGPQPWGLVEHGTYPETPEAAREQVRSHIEQGVDFIKVHDFLGPEIYEAIVNEALQNDQTVVGHLRSDFGPRAAIQKGQRDFEHVPPEMLSFCRADGKDRVRQFYNDWFSSGPDYFHRAMVDLYDAESCADLFSNLGENGVTVTPTLTLRKPISDARYERARDYLPSGYLELCEDSRTVEIENGPDIYERYDAMMSDVVTSLSSSGVTLLAGTDRPAGTCGLPGWDLIEELRSLVGAGLTHQQALQAATLDAAKKAERPMAGFIAIGADADLVLLRDNPLESFNTLDDPLAVISAGDYLDASELATLRQSAATYAKSLN